MWRFWPPSVEVIEKTGMYVLVDDGPIPEWYYDFIPNEVG